MIRPNKMNPSELRPGIYRVKIKDIKFNLSVIDSIGIIGVAGYFETEKQPKRGKHLLLTENVRNWISEIGLIERLL